MGSARFVVSRGFDEMLEADSEPPSALDAPRPWAPAERRGGERRGRRRLKICGGCRLEDTRSPRGYALLALVIPC